jgi:hypothetical protein
MRYLHSIGQASEKAIGAKNGFWSFKAVYDILSNRMYCGDMVQGKRSGNVSKKLPESKWVITENTHEAVVDRETFACVQKLFGKSRKSKTPYYKSPNTENIFAGKVFCGDCGAAMNRKRGGEKYYAFKCNTRYFYSEKACGGAKISENLLKSTLFNMLRGQEIFLPGTAEPDASAKDDGSAALSAVKSELDKSGNFLKGLYESLILGDITDAEYKEMKGGYEAKIASLSEREKRLRDNVRRRDQQEKALSSARKSVQTTRQILDLTAEIIGELVDRILVFEDKHIEVKFKFADETVTSGEVV